MSKMIQIRNVPDEVHRKIKARAAMAGLSMSDWVLGQCEQGLERPTRKEWLERTTKLPGPRLKVSVVDLIREDRERR